MTVDVPEMFSNMERPDTCLQHCAGPEQPTVEESKMPLRANGTTAPFCQDGFGAVTFYQAALVGLYRLANDQRLSAVERAARFAILEGVAK